MIATTLVVAAALIGQAPTPARSWQAVQLTDSTVGYVWGWKDAGGNVRWWPSEQQPGGPLRSIPPAPEAPPPPAAPINYGVDAVRLNADKRTIRASDPETLRLVEGGASLDDAERCPKPTLPFFPRTPDFDTLLLTAVLLAVALVLLVLGRRRQP